MSFEAKQPQVRARELKVQSLSIPLKIIGHATAASVVPSCDEPSLLFMKTAGVDQIAAALDSGDVATFSTSAADATGVFNVLVKIGQNVQKVVCAQLIQRDGVVAQFAKLGSASGLSSLGQSIMITCDCSVDFTGANTFDGCLRVEFICDPINKG